LVQIVEASDSERAQAVAQLGQHLVEKFGAPNLETARAAAEEEVTFAESLAVEDKDTLVAVHRRYEDGEIREAFRTLRPRNGPAPMRAFSFLEVDEESPSQPADEVSLVNLAARERK
jgi:hypothetical protein